MRRAGVTARKTARRHGTPLYLWKDGKIVAEKLPSRLDARGASAIILPQGRTVNIYDLAIHVEEIRDGGDYRYLATSPDLPGLLVAGETPEEVLSLAPSVAGALIASLQAEGDPLPATIHPMSSFPMVAHVAVTA